MEIHTVHNKEVTINILWMSKFNFMCTKLPDSLIQSHSEGGARSPAQGQVGKVHVFDLNVSSNFTGAHVNM